MRLLLDESLPRGIKRYFVAHEVVTVQEKGWAGKSNGELLRLAEREFDAFLTADQNLEYQQHLKDFGVGVIILASHTTRISDLEPLVPQALRALGRVKRGEVIRVALYPSKIALRTHAIEDLPALEIDADLIRETRWSADLLGTRRLI